MNMLNQNMHEDVGHARNDDLHQGGGCAVVQRA